MELKEYQNKSTRTLNSDLTAEQLISNMIFGANGELGEVTDILKKHLYQGHSLDIEHLKEEIGDTMFYIVNLATMFNIDMTDVLKMNVDKLLKRYPDGFDSNKSINRNEKSCSKCINLESSKPYFNGKDTEEYFYCNQFLSKVDEEVAKTCKSYEEK